jgi:tetratricopeptide (TPR) repeat protein
MSVQVGFELRRRSAPGPATALLVPDRDPAALLACCARLGLDPAGRVHDVAGGFLLKLDRPSAEAAPGAIRLRERAADFYLPVDAELIPVLLEDEARALVRDGGLVFLPGGRILRFDRRATVGWGELLRAADRSPRGWSPLPEPRPLAERIVEIAWELPDVSPEALYQDFEQGLRRGGRPSRGGEESDPGKTGSTAGPDQADAPEAADPAAGGAGAGSRGGAGASRAAAGLGAGVHGLARSLQRWLGQAGAGLREKVQWEWVDHSALVRKLLREFREGDPARALRHAFSMAPLDPSRRAVPWGNRLPWNRAIYNLLDLLGRPGRGEPAAVWRTTPDLLLELTREYRKAAERALRAGDCRRAAYIYGKLLGEDRMAAQALQRGGLHRDAAVLYLKKLDDPAAAAQAFEAAGEVDQAIALYRQVGNYEAAGDLLRRIGEEGAALAEYRRAAAIWAAAVPPKHLAAGLLLANKARRLDLAIEQFQAGWDRRPESTALPCALELLKLQAQRGAIGPIRELLDQAGAFYEAQGSDDEAGIFYNDLIGFTRPSPALQPYADELNDRVLVSLARRLRRGVADGHPRLSRLVWALLHEPNWSPPLLRDAEFAATAARHRPHGRDLAAGRDPLLQAVQVGRGTITAACQAAATAELFLGFDTGVVLGYHPRRNQIGTVAEGPGAVVSLAVDPDGRTVVALHRSERRAVMSCAVRRPDGSFRLRPEGHFPGIREGWLTSILPWGVDWLVGLGDGHDLLIVEAVSGTPLGIVHLFPDAEEPPAAAILLPLGSNQGPAHDRIAVLTHDGPRWILVDVEGQLLGRSEPAWSPAAAGPRPAPASTLSWWLDPPWLILVGLDRHGAVYATQFDLANDRPELRELRVATTDGGYLAATLCGMNTVVAVSPSRIDWLNPRGDRLQPTHSLKVCLPATIACFPTGLPQEVLVVGSEGSLARVGPERRVDRDAGKP